MESVIREYKMCMCVRGREKKRKVERQRDLVRSKKWKRVRVCVCVCVRARALSCVLLFATLWTMAYQAPLSMELSQQECWSGLLFSPPGDHPNAGIELASPALQAGFFYQWATREAHLLCLLHTYSHNTAQWFSQREGSLLDDMNLNESCISKRREVLKPNLLFTEDSISK